VVEALCDLKNEYIKFSEAIAETQAAIEPLQQKQTFLVLLVQSMKLSSTL